MGLHNQAEIKVSSYYQTSYWPTIDMVSHVVYMYYTTDMILQPIKKARFGRDRDVHNLIVSMVSTGSYRHSEVPPLPETIRKISSK